MNTNLDSTKENQKPSNYCELVAKWGEVVIEKSKTLRKIEFYDNGKAPPSKPDLNFVHGFDSINSFWDAAIFIEDWIRKKKHVPGEVARDLPVLMERALLIRAILRHVGEPTSPKHPSARKGKENLYSLETTPKKIAS